jgi:hypothetical protein
MYSPDDGRFDAHFLHFFLQLLQLGRNEVRPQRFQRAVSMRPEVLQFAASYRIASDGEWQSDPSALRQRIGAWKSPGFCVAMTKTAAATRAPCLRRSPDFAHHFQQRRLSARAGAIDFIGQQHIRKNGRDETPTPRRWGCKSCCP